MDLNILKYRYVKIQNIDAGRVFETTGLYVFEDCTYIECH